VPVYAQAQIIPDTTLAGENSRVRSIDSLTDVIEQGATRGNVLFHSFDQFSIGEGRRAYFSNPEGIESILSRVTGSNRSDIFGTLGVLGDANLFFLNPNGIVFGPNARLDVSGSFIASTGDRFNLSDGNIFSAIDPNAPPLLTVNVIPGLQTGAGLASIVNDGVLSAGQDLSLHGSELRLHGELTAGHHLTLQGDRIQIRDTAMTPFIANAGNTLTLEGNEIDILALNHPLSELVSGGDMVLRSRSPVIGDAHYRSGGNFRIETIDGGLGLLTSPRDPVIRAAGDVAFDSYTGASLHIFAGGSVTVPGLIEITGSDPANGLVETVVLSDSSTQPINGQITPTLDIRAGTMAVTPEGVTEASPPFSTNAPETSAEITLGSVQNPGGTVFLTNQYQPDLSLSNATITVGDIETAVSNTLPGNEGSITTLQVRGGDVIVDSRGGIALTGNVNTSAVATIGEASIRSIGDGVGEATGGRVQLIADGEVTTQSLTTSSQVSMFLGDAQPNDGLASDATAIATGGDIAVNTQQGFTALGDLTTSAEAVVEVEAIADLTGGLETVIGGEIGTASALVTGGDITIDTQSAITTNAVITASNTLIDAEAFADAFEFAPTANTANLAGGQIENVRVASSGGNIDLSSQTSITTGDLTTTAESVTFADTVADLATVGDINAIAVTGGTVESVAVALAGGDITLTAQAPIATGNQTTSTDTFAFTFANANVVTFANSNAVRQTGGTIDTVDLTAAGGDIELTTQNMLTTGDLNTLSRGFNITVNAGAGVNPFDDATVDRVDAQGGTIGTVNFSTLGGDITLNAQAATVTGELRTAAGFLPDITANVITNTGSDARINQINLAGGNIEQTEVSATGGDLTINTQSSIITDDLIVGIDQEVDVDASVDLFIEPAESITLMQGNTETVGVTATGGAIDFNAQDSITIGEILASTRSDVSVSTGTPDSTGAQVGALDVRTVGGDVALSAETDLVTGDSIESIADALVIVDGLILLGSDPSTGTAIGGNIALSSNSGEVILPEGGEIRSHIENGNGTGGNIRLEGASVALTDAFLVTTVPGIGSAGNITLLADNDVILSNSRLFTVREASAVEQGSAGNIEIIGASITFDDFSFLNTASFSTGDAGRVSLETTQGDIVLNDSSIFSLTAIEGDAAPVLLQSAGAVRLNGNSVVNTTVALGAVGQGANVTIEAEEGVFLTGLETISEPRMLGTNPNLSEEEPNDLDSPQLIDSAFSFASDPNVLFSEDVPFVQVIGSNDDGSSDVYSFTVESVGTQITFDVDAVIPTDPNQTLDADLTLRDDQGNRLAFNDTAPILLGAGGSNSSNDAYLTYIFNRPGTYTVELDLDPERLDIDETGTYTLNISRIEDALVNSGITTQTRSTGRSGNITLRTPRIDLQNGAQISAETLQDGRAGNITLQPLADGTTLNVALQEGTQITGSTFDSGRGGNLTLRAPDRVTISGGGRVAVETTGDGDAGNLFVETARISIRDGVTVSALTSAEATGNAGNLTLEGSDRLIIRDANVTVSSDGAGDAGTLIVQGDRLRVQDNGNILALTTGRGAGGNIVVETETAVTLNGNSLLSVETQGEGPAGNITLNTGRLSVAEAAQISATATEASTTTERGGSVTLNASRMNLSGTVGIFSETASDSPAGTLRLGPSIGDDTLQVDLANGAEISASTRSSGNGGDLVLQAEEAIAIRGNGRLAAATESSGMAGDVRVETQRFSLEGDVSLSAETTGSGTGGSLEIVADEVTIADGAEVTVSSIEAIAGNLSLVADQLTLDNGVISASTQTGTAGQLGVLVTDDIALSNSRISVEANQVNGRAGNLRLRARTLSVVDSMVTVSSPDGQAGNVDITADLIILDDGEVSAETGINSGSQDASANILLEVSDLLFMRNGSIISAQANDGANGGNIRIDAQEGFIVADELSNNDIIASALLDGTGGRIDIEVLRLFGLEARPGLFESLRENNTNDISASSEFGISGDIIIDELRLDPVQRAAELPSAPSSPRLAQGCRGTASSSRFVDTRRGGLPPQVTDLARGDRLWEAIGFSPNPGIREPESPDLEATTSQILEVDGWQHNDEGQIVLMASSSISIKICHGGTR